MEAYGAIDPQAPQETRLTNEEAQAVIGLWSLQRRLNEDSLSKPTVHDIAESLNISPDEVRKYLELARAQSRQARTPRSLKADLTLAFAAMAVLAFIVFCLAAAFIGTRSRVAVPAYVADYGTMSEARAVYVGGPNSGEVPRTALVGYSNGPKRIVIGVGTKLITPRYDYGNPLELSQVRKYIDSAVGGPLADNSLLKPGSITKDQVAKALGAGPSVPTDLLQWKKIQVAYGGKVIEAQFPFARIADKVLTDEVAAKQSRLIDNLAESVMSIIKG